jgi:AsmA protein
MADGALTGFDVERILRALQRGRLDRLAPRRDDRTPFSALTGTFDIAGGVAKTADLKLVSKQVELKGEGQIELGPRRIDATLQTKIDGGPPAEGAVVSIGTVELPIAIKGVLDRPEFTIKGQEALAETIGRIGKNLKSREVQDAIDGLLSGDKSKRVKPGELLEKLFKKE